MLLYIKKKNKRIEKEKKKEEKEDGRKYDRSGFVSYSLDDDEGLPFN